MSEHSWELLKAAPRSAWFTAGHTINCCDASSGHSVRPVAFCDTAERATAISTRVNAHDALVEALKEAELQIQYLHEKFQATGTGATVLHKIRAALAAAQPAGE